MKSLNRVQLIGHVGEDPRLGTFADGTRWANFSLATTDKWKDKKTGDIKSLTEWHHISVINPSFIDIIEKYVKKGAAIYIEGEIKSRKYNDKSGAEKTIVEIVLKFRGELILLNSKKEDEKTEVTRKTEPKSYQVPTTDFLLRPKDYQVPLDDLNDDVPF